MIPKPINNVAAADIDDLVRNKVPETRTIEYKRELPGSTDSDKREFLADVSSFANTAGGDLLFGVAEMEGLPTKVIGVQSANQVQGKLGGYCQVEATSGRVGR